MKISKSKQELARIISENGGWCDGAQWSVQNGDHGRISFSENKPVRQGARSWMAGGGLQFKIEVCKPLPNWHQTILSREEYFHLYPWPDAEGWIEFDGTERPSGYFNKMIDVKLKDGRVMTDSSGRFEWNTRGPSRIVAYRMHKPEPQCCESVTRSIRGQPTFDQLLRDWRNADDYAKRKQAEADEAAAMRDKRWQAVQARAGELDVTIGHATKWRSDAALQITNHSQLELGDVIWIGRSGVKEDELRLPEGEYQVVKVGTVGVLHNGSTFYPDFSFRSWRFIRRP